MRIQTPTLLPVFRRKDWALDALIEVIGVGCCRLSAGETGSKGPITGLVYGLAHRAA
jgi:hypothetical protein